MDVDIAPSSGYGFRSIVPQYSAGANAAKSRQGLSCVILGKRVFVSKIGQICSQEGEEMKHKVLSWIALGCLAAALFLMALPTSTTMVFAAGPGTRIYAALFLFQYDAHRVCGLESDPDRGVRDRRFWLSPGYLPLPTANQSWFRAARITASLAGGFSLLMLFLHTQMDVLTYMVCWLPSCFRLQRAAVDRAASAQRER
jgi:lipid-A-disaccharide synthase-like uncharacterized protein